MRISGTVKVVGVGEVGPNPWNPQRMDPETFEREKRSIRDEGFISPIVVRTVSGPRKYQIVDGEHRYRAAVELGMAEVRALDLGDLPDHRAKALTLKLNDIRGSSDEDLKAALIRDLMGSFSPLEMMEALPYDQNYYTQFPEFMAWADASGEQGAAEGSSDEGSVSVPLPTKPTYEGMTLLHFLVPNDDVREFRALVRRAVAAEPGCGGLSDEVVLGRVVLRLLQAESGGEG